MTLSVNLFVSSQDEGVKALDFCSEEIVLGCTLYLVHPFAFLTLMLFLLVFH